jgi:hypothetical protein
MPDRQLVLDDLRDQLLRCGEFMAGPAGSASEGEREPAVESGPFFPHSPDTEFFTWLVKVGELQNQAHTVKLIDGNKWGLFPGPVLPDEKFVQSTVEAVDSPYQGMRASAGGRLSGVRLLAPSVSASASDALAECRGGK